MKIENRKARHNYTILEKIECGVSLRGNEVKSIRSGMCNINEAWVSIENGQLVVKNMNISKWDTSNMFDISERRDRVLLVHKSEIRRLSHEVKTDGITLVPLRVYFSDRNKCKVEIGVCKGKKLYDKREDLKKRQVNIEISRSHLSKHQN